MDIETSYAQAVFYDNSILSGTKISKATFTSGHEFYDNSILSGTKMAESSHSVKKGFYDNSILSGTKIISRKNWC